MGSSPETNWSLRDGEATVGHLGVKRHHESLQRRHSVSSLSAAAVGGKVAERRRYFLRLPDGDAFVWSSSVAAFGCNVPCLTKRRMSRRQIESDGRCVAVLVLGDKVTHKWLFFV